MSCGSGKNPTSRHSGQGSSRTAGSWSWSGTQLWTGSALEMSAGNRDELPPTLTVVLERLLEMKARPAEVTRWSDDWFGAQSVFVYETFLYVVATLIRKQGFHVVRSVFETHYMLPETERHGESFGRFDRFQGHSSPLSTELIAPNGQRYLSAEAELFKRQATRTDISFKSLMEAELLVIMAAMVGEGLRWYPGDPALRGLQLGAAAFSRGDEACGFRKTWARGGH